MVGTLRHTLHHLKPLNLKRATAPGYVGDGGGLYLQITKSGARSWIFRYSLGGQRREMGLGAFSRARTDDPRPSASLRVIPFGQILFINDERLRTWGVSR
jgi:hypothetical protein